MLIKAIETDIQRDISTPNNMPLQHISNMHFRLTGFDTSQTDIKGIRPTTEPATMQDVPLMMIIHISSTVTSKLRCTWAVCFSSMNNLPPNPLRNLKDPEFQLVKGSYEQYTQYIRVLTVGIAVLQLLWDCMLLYYHRMVEQVLSGIFAICTWYLTYRVWFPSKSLLPLAAGRGVFQYQRRRQYRFENKVL